MSEVAVAASECWGLPVATISLVAQRENITFRLDAVTGQSYALRLHRPGYHDLEQLEAEMQWLCYLAAQGLEVATPVASSAGHLMEQVDGYHVSVLRWLDGQAMGQSGVNLQLQNKSLVFYQLGQSMARLHTMSDDWSSGQSLARPHWNLEGLLGDAPLWGAFWSNPELTPAQKRLFNNTRASIQTQLEGVQQELDYGLIHADFVRENIILHKDKLQLIDFDDSGFGFRLFELATCLLANANEPDYSRLQTQLIAGYQIIRPLDVTHLQVFVVLRALTYVAWVVPRLHEQGGAARSQRFIQRAVLLCEQYARV